MPHTQVAQGLPGPLKGIPGVLPSREPPVRASSCIATHLRASSVLPCMLPNRENVTSYAPARGHSVSRGDDKPGMSSSSSQAAIASTGPGTSASSMGGSGPAGSSSSGSGIAGASSGMWPRSPEPRVRMAWQSMVSRPPARDGASLASMVVGPLPRVQGDESLGSARGGRQSVPTERVNGGSGSCAIAHGDEVSKVVRQISFPSRSDSSQVQPSQPPLSVPWPALSDESNGELAAAPGRPPPQVVTYSARAGRQPYLFALTTDRDPRPSVRSPGRARPPQGIMSLGEQLARGDARAGPSNRSPTRSRPQPYIGYPRPYHISSSSEQDAFLPGAHSPYQSAGALAAVPQEVQVRGGCSCGGRVSLAEVATPSTGSNAGRPNPAEATSPNAPDWQAVPCVSGAASVGSPVQGLSVEVQPPRSCVEGDDDMELYGLPGEDQHNEPHWDEPPPHKAKGQLTVEERIAYHDLQFVEHLGSGEFGQVFRGFHKDQEVAIKQLYWDNSVLPQVIIEDLEREVESFRHLTHKRLVCFVGACLEIPNLCLVTEYMPGGSLHHLLHVRKLRLPLLHCINMCLQLADGVMYLHSQTPCVVHRDLKSLNVVLDMKLNVKLCDFGLTESMDRTHITKKNNGGSPRYMAPELFDNKSKITEKVDIWSLGCIFTEVFGGPLPYEGINTLADLTREMLVNRRVPTIPEHIPEPIQSINRSCYNFDYRLRPSARQVFDQFKEVKKRLRAQGLL